MVGWMGGEGGLIAGGEGGLRVVWRVGGGEQRLLTHGSGRTAKCMHCASLYVAILPLEAILKLLQPLPPLLQLRLFPLDVGGAQLATVHRNQRTPTPNAAVPFLAPALHIVNGGGKREGGG